MKKLKNLDIKWKIIFLLIVIPISIGIILPNFNVNNGSDDGWLGFWGGYLGAILAVVGVWWQTNKTIKNEKELMFSQKRPYIILQELSADKVDEVYGINNCDLKDKFQILVIKNLSNQPFFSVKIVLNDQVSPVIIDRIDKNKDIGILVNSIDVNKLQEAERNLKESVAVMGKVNLDKPKQLYDNSIKEIKEIFDKYNQDFEGLGLSKDATKVNDDRFRQVYTSKYNEGILDKSIVNITKEIKTEKVTIYFTTTVREKVKLVFKKEDKRYRYQKNETKLENKGSTFTEKEYDTSDMYESYKLK